MTTVQLEYKVQAEQALASLTELRANLEKLKEQQQQVAESSDEYKRLGDAISALDSQVGNSQKEFERLSSIAEGTANTMKSLKAEAKLLENALASVDPGTAEYTKLAGQLNSVRDRMKDVKESSNLGGSAFEQLATKSSLLRGDIENLDFAGVGEKLTDLSTSLRTVKFSDFTDGLKSAGQGVVALGRTLLASPIGIFVAAIGAVAGALAIWKSAASEVDETLSNTLTTQQQVSDAEQADLDALNGKTEQLKAQGKSQKEILALKQKETAEVITALEAQLVTQKEVKRQQVESAERNKSILTGIIKFVTAPLQLMLGSIDLLTQKLRDVGVISDETFKTVGNLRGKFNDFIDDNVSTLLFDPKAAAEEGDKTIKETEDRLAKLKEQQAGYANEIDGINRAAAEKAAEERKKRNEALAQALKEERDMRIAAIADESARQKAALEAELADRKAAVQARIDATTGNSAEEQRTRAALLEQIRLLEQKHADDLQAIDDAAYAKSYAELEASLAKERELRDRQFELEAEIDAARAERSGSAADRRAAEVEALAREFDDKFALAEGNADLEAKLQEELNDRVAAINKKYRDEEQAAEQKAADDLLEQRLGRIAKAQEALGQISGALSQIQGVIDAFGEENAARAEAEQQAQTEALNAEQQRRVEATAGNEEARAAVEQEFANRRSALERKQLAERNERAKRDFTRNKRFQLAQATISGAAAVLQAYQSQLTVPTPDAPIRGAFAAAAAGVVAAAQIAAIARTKFQGESGGGEGGGGLASAIGGSTSGGSAPSTQPLQFQQASQQQQQGAVVQANQPVRVFVVESDIREIGEQRDRRDAKTTVVE